MSIANKTLSESDYVAGGAHPLKFERMYNSSQGASSAATWAQGWTHTFGMYVSQLSPTTAVVAREDGKSYLFTLSGSSWISDSDVTDTLIQLTSAGSVTGWQYTRASDDSIETYDSYGNLSSIAYREGTVVTLTYTANTTNTFPAQLASVSDSFGSTLSFTLSQDNISIQDPNGGTYTYTLGTNGTLSSVMYPDASSRSYLYNESTYTGGTSLPFSLTGVIDENASRYDSTWYGADGSASQTALAGNVNQFILSNSLDGTGRIQSVSMQNSLGATEGRGFTSSVGRNRLSSVSKPTVSGQPAGSAAYSFDTNGNVSESTDLNGNLNCSVFDLTRNLETGRVEGIAIGSTCPSNIATYVPMAGTVQRKILTQWHPVWHLPAKRAEPLKITTWVYNGDGGSYCAPTSAKVGTNPIGVVCSRSEQGTTDATGGAGFGATASGPARVWNYTYNSFGEVLTVNGPRTDVADITTYTYYTCATGAQCGQINTITNALGQVTTFLSYDGNGNPLTISDPNGIVTTLTYDARQRLKSRQIGSETTSYSYYPTGLLDVVTLPDGSTVQYTYDAAHRLTKITDGAGNYISYTLDAMGNRTAENSFDSTGSLHRTHTRVFNTLSTLYQDITAAGTPAVTTTFGYDAQGNQTSVAAPLSRNTTNAFDALNRLSQITDPAGGVTRLAYDAKDNLASVTDPRSLSTTYTNDGFGDVVQQVSPDTGTTINTYDSAGNLNTATDARGAVATYAYDALNRVAQLAYSDQVINFTYDAGTNGIGRLTGASDANHALSWSYDTYGRVIGKGQTVGSVTKSVGYAYTNDDLTSLVTPSGQTITYGYINHRISSISMNGKSLLSGVTYEPFGSVNGWTWGNSTTVGRTYSTDEQVTQLNTAGDVIKFGYDNALRLTSVADKEVSANSWSAGYDVLDRVTSAATTGTSYGWTYDADGNRLTQSGSNATTFNPASSSNRLSSTTGSLARTYSYDGAGNTASYASDSFTFNQRGRMALATANGASTHYLYSALGQMIEKSGASATTLFMYDEAGHLLGEYSSSGALIEETIWMGDVPVATLRPSGSSISVYYIHSDQFGSPRAVTLPSNNALAWLWSANPYGVDAPNQNPQGLGTFVYNLRFPGQYYQAETGLNYNYFRDYDPQTGRYLESDPIGLKGGINTYAYVLENPIYNVDPSGISPPGRSPPGYSFPSIFPPIYTFDTPENRRAALALEQALNNAADAIISMCRTSDKSDCLKEIEQCMKTCQRARKDPNQRNVWAGSWWRCLTGCVPFRCQKYIDEQKHGDPEK